MTRSEVTGKLLEIFSRQFEIDNPELDVDLREAYEFDSIDAIELLREIEILLGDPLTREEKKKSHGYPHPEPDCGLCHGFGRHPAPRRSVKPAFNGCCR